MAITNASRLADFGSGIGTEGAIIHVDNTNARLGIGTANPQAMLQVGTGVSVYGDSGIVSATSYYGSGANLTGIASTDNVITDTIKVLGVSTFVGNSQFDGNVSIAGTLTYEDVTNIDSVGIVTARSGINVTAGDVNVTSGDVKVGAADTQRVTISSSGIGITGGYYRSHATAIGQLAIDCSAGNYFTKTINSGSQAFTFTSVPDSVVYSMTVEVTHTSGSATITWPAEVKWPGDAAPSLTDGKTTLFMFVTDDGGARWRGSTLTNYTT